MTEYPSYSTVCIAGLPPVDDVPALAWLAVTWLALAWLALAWLALAWLALAWLALAWLALTWLVSAWLVPTCLLFVLMADKPALDTCWLTWSRPDVLALAGLRPPAANTPIAHPMLVTATAVRRINTPCC